MNSFNPDQNPHILSSPELPEGGGVSNQSSVPQSSVPQTESEIMSPAELTAERVGENLEGEATIEGGEVTEKSNPDLNIENLSSLIEQAAEAVQKDKEQISFETDPDTGLSLQGAKIEELKAQLEAIQKGETSEIDNEIQADRSTGKEILLANLASVNTIKINTDNQIKSKGHSLEDLIKVSPELAQELELLQSQLTEAEQNLAQYEEETTRQILEARQLAESQLQSELESTQEAYLGSDAELSDRKILLEMGLQDNLTDTDALFSNRTIQQVFDTYGLQEGLKRLQQLRIESNDAREKAAKAKIQTDIISRVDWYAQIPDLAQALDQDIEAKLQTLKQQNPDSDTIPKALSRDGKDRLRYLINSGDSQLQELAFWFSKNKNNKTEAEILAEHQNFAKYVKQQTEKRYKEEQQEKRYYLRQGQGHISMIVSEAEKQLQKDIDINIKEQFNRAKADKIEALRRELKNLQLDEYGRPFDSLDQSMSSVRDNLRQDEIDNFQAELAQALQSGKITVNRGSFNRIDISGEIEEMNSKLQNIESTINSLVQNNEKISIEFRDRLKSIIQVSRYDKEKINETIKEKIEKISDKKRFKLLGIGRKQIEDLINLQQGIESELTKYTTLKSKQQEKLSENELDRENSVNLKQAYNKLPKSIQDTLSALENPSLDTITQAITSGVEEIQNYQTPSEITERREQITSLESQITETKDIKAPSTQATT